MTTSSPSPRRIVIVGATSAIAEHCARRWVADGPVALTLVGRDAARTERIAADLRVRSPQAAVEVRTLAFDDARAIQALADALAAAGAIDVVLIAHGSLPEQAAVQGDLEANRAALEINAVSPALFAEAFAGHLQRAGRGTLAIIGSVAGDRGRRSNYVYGAAKGLVARYAEGLQHRFAGSAVRVVLVKPGPTATPMTAHLKNGGRPLAPVDRVAADIVRAVARGTPVCYTPGKWALIMGIIRHLPRVVFDRMDI